jgi:hypothetical protein
LTLVVFVPPRFIRPPSLRQDAIVGRSRALLSIAAQAPADRAQLIPEGPLAIARSNLSRDDGAPTASCTVRVPRDTSDQVAANVGIAAAHRDA